MWTELHLRPLPLTDATSLPQGRIFADQAGRPDRPGRPVGYVRHIRLKGAPRGKNKHLIASSKATTDKAQRLRAPSVTLFNGFLCCAGNVVAGPSLQEKRCLVFYTKKRIA